jgi:hypothetical protein
VIGQHGINFGDQALRMAPASGRQWPFIETVPVTDKGDSALALRGFDAKRQHAFRHCFQLVCNTGSLEDAKVAAMRQRCKLSPERAPIRDLRATPG